MAFVFATVPVTAGADPIADKKAQAAAVQSQISSLDTKVEIAAERYNVASDRYATVTAKVQSTQAKISQIRSHMGKLQGRLDTRADDMYRSGPLGFLEVLLNAKSFEDFNTTWDLLKNMSTQDASVVADLKQAKRESEVAYLTLKQSQAEAKQHKLEMASAKASVLGQLSERKRTLAGLNSDIRALVAAQQAAEAAAQAASYHSSGGGFVDVGGNPPSNASQGEKVVYWARRQLGKPYVWAASGPDSFDCSGLAMYCWGKVGVSLPHSSAEQIGSGARVSRANLEPGDLVFFGSPIHHVGIYIGGGEMIEAPYTGASVRVANAFRGDYAGACRP